ncbi:MAG: TetR/AcrR family transcriptional regulator [Planctomycetales bacterium]|nr:TetR/AcrR family transcriptional regulator [Planctomycetales bacterium]
MNAKRAADSRGNLVQAATELMRKQGYVATTVDQICAEAGVTKGAFFHHFKSKQELAAACLHGWDELGEEMDRRVGVAIARELGQDADPVDIALRYMDWLSSVFADPKLLKSCLAGTIAQELADGATPLREAANSCFVNAERRLKSLLDAACRSHSVHLDTGALASLWMATLQGSLILFKASGDDGLIPRNLQQVRNYISSLLVTKESKGNS